MGVTGAIPGQLSQGTIIDQNLNRVEIATLVLIAVIILLAYRSSGRRWWRWRGSRSAFRSRSGRWGNSTTASGSVSAGTRPGGDRASSGNPHRLYDLLPLRRSWRLSKGDDRLTATRTTIAEFTPIIVTSAVILSCGLLALLASTLGFFRDLGPALALTVGVALVVSVTLIPALIATFGGLVFWPRPEPGRIRAWRHRSPAERALARSPLDRFPTAVLCLAALGLAAWQLQSLHLGFGQISDLPASSEPGWRAGRRTRIRTRNPAPTSVIIQAPNVASTASQPAGADAASDRQTARRRSHARPSRTAHTRQARRVLRTQRRRSPDRGDLQARPTGRGGHRRSRPPGIGDAPIARQTGLTGTRISYAGDTALADDTVSDIRQNMLRVAVVVLP